MARLTSQREKGRNWTANTFLPDNNKGAEGGVHSIDMTITSALHAITEDAMDEDMLDTVNGNSGILSSTKSNARHATSSFADEEFSSNSNSDGAESPEEEEEEDHGGEEDENDDEEEDEEEGSSSQDQTTSEDSSDNTSDDQEDEDEDSSSNNQNAEHRSTRIDVPKRSSRTGLKKKRVASLSTSPSSKIVSATPTKKITKKSKKSVKPKSSKGSLSTAAARQATEEAKLEAAKPIVSRFLELENTKLNDKLLQVFMINGMISYVIESITRLDPEIAKNIDDGMDDDANQESKFMTRVEQCRRTRDYSDLNLMKKSYTAMNFITRSDVYNEFILSSSHQSIVRELFKIFRPESNGNFHHFQKVFDTILKKFRVQTMATVFEDVDPETGLAKTPLIFDMLPFLDQAPVALCMIKILFPTYSYGFTEKIRDYYRTLQNGHYMEMLLAMVTLFEEPSSNMADFVVSLLDEATRAKESRIIFSCLADDPIWAERLAQGVQSSSTVKRHGCIEIIYSILVRSIQVPFQNMFAESMYVSDKVFERVETHLESIGHAFGKHLASHIPDLCRAFIGSKKNGEQVSLSGFTVPSSFTVARLWLLDSVYHCLNDVKDEPSLLESIPEVFWTTLVDSFFQFRFNNAFHVQFYKLFRVVLYSEQATVFDRFFVRTNFVSRLIEHYGTAAQPTGSRGYIILILNCIRLSADVEVQQQKEQEQEGAVEADPQEGFISPTFWSDLLRASPDWPGFQETLRSATLEQTRDTSCDMAPGLRFQFAPLQSRQPNEAPLTKRHIGIPGISARGNDGIDLGSQYGNSLGFGVPMKYDRAAYEEIRAKAEHEQELSVQKALANLMPNIDWKQIPPQRVLSAMGVAVTKTNKTSTLTNEHGTSAAVGTNGTTKQGENGGEHSSKDGTTGTTKPKKKKKNKKKRQISSVHSEGDDHGEDGSSLSSTAEDSSEEVSGTGSSQSSSEANGAGGTGGSELTEEDALRLERKREKKREKKRKNRMNKKNKTHVHTDQDNNDLDPSSAASSIEAMEL
ncbi:hypothetical protein EDD11_004737 [Mortierella claussenii]|nr:hypothetical protein EDD11_004737 [Mortierella claussenii]